MLQKKIKELLKSSMLRSTDEDVKEYVEDLNSLIKEMNVIKEMELVNQEKVIYTSNNNNIFNEFKEVNSIDKNEVFKNNQNKLEGFITVPKVIE